MKRYVSLILFVLLATCWTHAQSDEMIAYNNGDLFAWSLSNNVPEQLTFWGYNGGGLLSPDGSTIAFLSFDGAVGEKIASGELYLEFGALPSNIWVMDIASREFQWINDQSTANDPEVGIYRSYPVWSPDGTQLAWVELNNYPNVSIQIYDFDTNTISTLVDDFSMVIKMPEYGCQLSNGGVVVSVGSYLILSGMTLGVRVRWKCTILIQEMRPVSISASSIPKVAHHYPIIG